MAVLLSALALVLSMLVLVAPLSALALVVGVLLTVLRW